MQGAGDVDTRFFFYWLDGRVPQVAYQGHWPETKRLQVDLPPLPEQRAIAAILDTIDEAIRRTEQVIAKLRLIKQGLLHDMLTRGIDENGELRPPPEEAPELYKESALGMVPKGWEVCTLEQLTTQIVDGIHHTPTYVERGIPFLTVENLNRGSGISFKPCRFISKHAHIKYRRRAAAQPGDVLVSKDGTLGIARVVSDGLPEFSIFVSVALLKPRRELIEPELIQAFFDSPSFLSQLGYLSAGTGLKHIHLEHFRAFQLCVPPPIEQLRLTESLQTLERRLSNEHNELAKVLTIKYGLMDDLLTGRVRVKISEERG